jgi:putative Mg2+ transporter-C (MgtC) family protein
MLSTHVEILESIGRLSVALALGSVIGIERQWRQKMAGLRTNALVALGSCGFVVFSAMVGTFAGAGFWAPSLVAAGFVVGTNLLLRPLVGLINSHTVSTAYAGSARGVYSGADTGNTRFIRRSEHGVPPAT